LSRRIPEPASDGDRAVRVRAAEELWKIRYALPRGRAVSNHEQASDEVRLPATRPADHVAEACFAIVRGDRRLGIRDDRLDLDDEERLGAGVPPNNIDRATLAEMAEGDLDGRLPAMRVEQADDLVDQPGVRRIEESVEALAMPPNTHVEIGAQRVARRLDMGERHPPDLASLDPRALARRDPGADRHVGLSHPAANPERAKRPADPKGVHPASLPRTAYVALTDAHRGPA
jgi:hypothetical protein